MPFLSEFTYTLPAQILGFIAMFVDIRASYQKKDQQLKKMHALASLIFSAHFFLLSAWVGAASELLNSVRTYMSIKGIKKKTGIFFCLVYALLMLIMSDGFITHLPFIASISITYGIYFCHGKKLRLLYLLGWFLWLVYSIAVVSVGAIILFMILCSTTTYTILKMGNDLSKKNGD